MQKLQIYIEGWAIIYFVENKTGSLDILYIIELYIEKSSILYTYKII